MKTVGIKGVEALTDKNGFDLSAAQNALCLLKNGAGTGNDFLGWLRIHENTGDADLSRIAESAARIRENSDALVIIGIGGSYLGARAAIDMLRSPRYNELKKSTPDIYFIGNGFSGDDILEVVDLVSDRDFSVNVISKSGTTLEPALAFRIFRELLIKKYGEAGARSRVIATTSPERGVLKSIADECGYEKFIIPDDVGGRYSVLTPVGLIPMAAAGIDITRVLAGAAEQMTASLSESPGNPASLYAAARQYFYRCGKKLEVLSYPGESSRFFAEWWKQLYGESEGKDGLGLFPASCAISADLHSLGQYMQEGERLMFETMLSFEKSRRRLVVPSVPGDPDKLNFTAGRDFDHVFNCALEGTRLAHIKGGVPCLELTAGAPVEETFGALVSFFEVSCGISGYMMGVNPFDQPGVEEYKRNMFSLLGKE